MKSAQYIKVTVRGSRGRVAKVASARGIPFRFVRQVREDGFVETVGKVELAFKRMVSDWLRESTEHSDQDGALLAYAVTTDARERARQTEQQERIEAAKRILADRSRRAKRKAAATDAGSDVVNLTTVEAAERPRTRQRAPTKHDAKAPVVGAAELLPTDETAVSLPAGAAQAGQSTGAT